MPASNWLPGNTEVLTEVQNKTEGNKHHVGLISNAEGESRERRKKDFHGNQPEFLVPFITVVITYPVSVSFLKSEFREGRGMCNVSLLYYQHLVLGTDFTKIFSLGQPG